MDNKRTFIQVELKCGVPLTCWKLLLPGFCWVILIILYVIVIRLTQLITIHLGNISQMLYSVSGIVRLSKKRLPPLITSWGYIEKMIALSIQSDLKQATRFSDNFFWFSDSEVSVSFLVPGTNHLVLKKVVIIHWITYVQLGIDGPNGERPSVY